MVEETRPSEAYSSSDKLGIALACLSSAMAIILFLVEKTPFAVVSLLIVMAALSVYPILHFAKRRGVRVVFLVCIALGTVLFGFAVWPKNKNTVRAADTASATQGAAPTSPVPQQTQPATPPNTTQPKPEPSTGQSATANSKGDNSPAGAINQQGQGNTAIVGSNNTVGSSADEIANKVAERLGPTLKGGFHEIPDKIVVELGSGSAEDSYINAKRAGVLHPLQVGNSLPIEIRITNDDKILFTFKSWDAGLPIEVKDNEVKIGNEQVQRNFSENAFEVVNKAGEPLFQMIRKSAGTIHINGVFPTGKISQVTGRPLLLWLSDDTGLYWSSIKPNPWLKPIFKYPAWKYPGVFADN
jgi:hypothetical protein